MRSRAGVTTLDEWAYEESCYGRPPGYCQNLKKQRGTLENLWPKFILQGRPVARHFVWGYTVAAVIPLLK